MLIAYIDNDGTHSNPIFSEWYMKENTRYGKGSGNENYFPHYNYVGGPNKLGTSIFHSFFNELIPNSDGYLDAATFRSQMEAATEAFKEDDFQLVTFNVPENEKFKAIMPELGFELMGQSPGNHGTLIFLYVKTKKEK